MQDLWESGDPYEYFMGRWSRLVGRSFVDWLALPAGKKWLDIGCGTGALSDVILNTQNPSELTAIDRSEGFVSSAQKRLGSRVQCKVGNATSLPIANASVDCAVSGLVLNFIPEPAQALQEMQRVVAPGGLVATYIWDYPGKMEFLEYFWDAVVELDASASSLHEGNRFPEATAEGLEQLFKKAGLLKTTVAPLEIQTEFSDFDDYWKPFLGGQGPAPTYVLSLSEENRNKLENHLHERLPIKEDGSISITARAWAAKIEV